uniref:ATPase AAA-type core domain-containing protein n=2 Tax=Wuchereria bancrofti TaxID=6293 RepID=A0AAF5Q4E7_WUCBA
MATNEETISEQCQIHPLNGTTSSTDKNMNDSLEKAAFGRKHLRRRSSLFFRNTEVNNAVPDDVSNFNCRSSSGKTLERKVITLDSKRRTSMNLRKSIYRTRSKAAVRKFEITCEPPPVSLKPILLNITQKTVRRITMRAKGWNKHKRVHFHSVPQIHEITPRSGKIPGVVKMPDSPPTVKELAIKEIASDNKELDIPTTQSVILQDFTTNTFQNEIVRFLPAISQTFQCHLDEEKVVNECLEAKNDEGSSGAVDNNDHALKSKERNVDRYMDRKRAVNRFEVSNLSEINSTVKRPKRRVEEKATTWVRGDRLRSLSLGIKQDVNADKENGNLNILNDKQSNDEQKCNEASDGLQHLRASLLVVPRTGPKAKVKKWLQDLPNQWCHLVDEDAFMWNQQKQITDENMIECNSILIKKHSLRRQSFGGLPKKQNKRNKCCRKSLLFQKAVSKLSAPNRSQAIIVGEAKENVYGESSFSNTTCTENVDQSRCSASAVSCNQNTDEVVLLDDQGLSNIPGNSLTFYKNKIDTRNTRQTTTNKAETIMKSSSICGDKLIGEEMNSMLKLEKKPVFTDEMDFAPFPSVSNIGYAEIPSVNYDLPCELRQHQIPKVVLYNNNTFQISFRKKSFCEDEELEQKVDSRIPSRSRSARKKLSKSRRWKSLTEELQENTWSEALRPMKTDELIVDGPTVRKLCDWINMWKERLRKSRNNKKDVIVPTRRKKRDSDSDSFDSDEKVEQLCNTAIIYGHCGSGKTSLVYAVSKRYEMHVLEIASNEKRNGLQLKCKLQGATHSHKFPMSTMVNQMFFRNEKNDGKMIEDSIILVDDCDVIYDKHDDGFWPALRVLCREARTPIIIICEDISLVRKQLGFEVPVLIFPLIRPEVQTVSSHLQEICAALNISVCSDTCCALAEQYNGDLRACINQLQFYSGEDSNNSLRMLMKRLKSEEQTKFETLSKKCHFISYNVMLRHDHSYEPRTILSLTDREEEDLHNVEKSDMHAAVKITRSVLPATEYFPLSDVILDYIPYLCIMDKASRAKMPASRRAQHYFDELHGDSQIDSSGTLKNVLTQYYLLNY